MNKKGIYLSDYPDALKLWDSQKNGDLDPSTISYRSHQEVWWKCFKGTDHEWQASVARITQRLDKGGKPCPICSGYLVVPSNCLGTTHPEIAKSWHPTKNGELTPFLVTAGSNQKVWWKCSKGEDHEWEATVNNRVDQGCPCCSGRKVCKANSLETLYPEIAKEFHTTKNGMLTPANVVAASNKKAWWVCSKAHEYEARIAHRTLSGSGCPYCSGHKLAYDNSLEFKRPDLAKEFHTTKNGKLTPSEIHVSSGQAVWWQCANDPDHVWRSTVDNRRKGNGCPLCNLGWTWERIRLFVKSILPLIARLNEAELYLLCLKSGALNASRCASGRPFIKALSTGKFPKDELEKFANNEPSLVDSFIKDSAQETHEPETEEKISDKKICPDDLNELVDIHNEHEGELPTLQAKDVLVSLDNPIFASFERDDVEFFIKSAVSKIWQHVFVDESTAIHQIQGYDEKDGLYSSEVKKLFLLEYNSAKCLKIPEGYNFSSAGLILQPNIMQLYTASILQSRKRIGNWSGTGAGKTLAAVLASRVIEAKTVLIFCPNNVVAGWKEKIEEIYPDSIVETKRVEQTGRNVSSRPLYLIINYEFVQRLRGITKLNQFLDNCLIDFIIIDEIHYSKQRHKGISSIRRRAIGSILYKATSSNDKLCVLGMSATPVINNLFEGKTLLELVSGTEYKNLGTAPTVSNCILMYQKFISHGIRMKPKYSCALDVIVENIDCSELVPEVKRLGANPPVDDLDGILIKAKIPYILKQIHSKTIVYSHFWNKNGALDLLQTSLQNAGWKVVVFTGESKEGLHEFIAGDADVLIASSCIGTGIDKLQLVCSRMIIASLPWTHAEFEQLKGRVYRQGQKNARVQIFIPLTFSIIEGRRWSWCEARWQRIKFKKSIADAAVDGVVPEGHLQSPAQAVESVMKLLSDTIS